MLGILPTSLDFPGALRESLQAVRGAMEELPEAKKEIAGRAVTWLMRIAQNADLDVDVRTALTTSIRQFSKVSEVG